MEAKTDTIERLDDMKCTLLCRLSKWNIFQNRKFSKTGLAVCVLSFQRTPLFPEKEHQNSVVAVCAPVSEEEIKYRMEIGAYMRTLDFKAVAEVDVQTKSEELLDSHRRLDSVTHIPTFVDCYFSREGCLLPSSHACWHSAGRV